MADDLKILGDMGLDDGGPGENRPPSQFAVPEYARPVFRGLVVEQCGRCGALLVDKDAHTDFHYRVDQVIDKW